MGIIDNVKAANATAEDAAKYRALVKAGELQAERDRGMEDAYTKMIDLQLANGLGAQMARDVRYVAPDIPVGMTEGQPRFQGGAVPQYVPSALDRALDAGYMPGPGLGEYLQRGGKL